MVVKSFNSYFCFCCCKKDKDTIALKKGQGYLDSINEEIEILKCLENPKDKEKYVILKNLKAKYKIKKKIIKKN